MFNLFKKKEGSVRVIDKIWMSQEAKWQGIVSLWKKNTDLVIVTWFDTTLRHLESLLSKESTSTPALFSARTIHGSQITGKDIIFAEHHPMRSKELAAFNEWNLKQAVVHSALDEPIFKHFGSDKIVGMMKSLGMSDDTMIENNLVSSAIQNAQEKIEKKVVTEHSASSQQEWIDRNL